MKKTILIPRTNKSFIIGLVILLSVLTGCLKSLNPFYTAEQLVNPAPYVGVWKSSNNTYWVFMSTDLLEDDSYTYTFSEEELKVQNSGLPDNIKVDGKIKLQNNIEEVERVNTIADSFKVDSLQFIADIAEDLLNSGDLSDIKAPSNEKKPFIFLVQFQDSVEAVNFYNDPESIDMEEDDELYIAAFFSFEGRTMLDISPYELFGDNSFKGRHHVAVHSLSLVDDMADPAKMRLQFFSSSKISSLIEEDRVRIDYLETKPFPDNVMSDEENDGELFLTAKTADLQAFIKKLFDMGDESYLSSNGNYMLKKIELKN